MSDRTGRFALGSALGVLTGAVAAHELERSPGRHLRSFVTYGVVHGLVTALIDSTGR